MQKMKKYSLYWIGKPESRVSEVNGNFESNLG